MRAISFGAQSSRYVEVQKKYEYRRVIQMSSSNQFSKPTMGSSKHNRGITAQQLEQLYVDYQMSAPYKCQYEGGPRFFSPLIPWMCYENAQELPVMIFLPGIDGTGFGAFRQFCRLAQIFNLSILLTPTSDRTCFQDLIAIVKEYLELEAQSISTSRPIYLFGESFGAIMAMAVAVECRDIVDRLILVNPASGFPRTLWKQAAPILAMMPAQIYDYFPYFMMPLFANVAAVVSHRVDYKSTPQQQISQLLQGMVEQLPEADALQLLLPHDCLLWKIQQVDSGCQYMEQVGGYQNVLQRTLILTSDQDLIVPARQEGERLQNMLPRVTTVNLANRAHAVLLEAGVDLANIIKRFLYCRAEHDVKFSGEEGQLFWNSWAYRVTYQPGIKKTYATQQPVILYSQRHSLAQSRILINRLARQDFIGSRQAIRQEFIKSDAVCRKSLVHGSRLSAHCLQAVARKGNFGQRITHIPCVRKEFKYFSLSLINNLRSCANKSSQLA
eukprot:TRINITY_DN4423_c0_g2_i2.p1 TRINITY_DN4423_c0_g2~~TRINITY_DN4423_c0_g2_i2.p1  ORF type:complete len:498 (-),score=47.09 TRINITY_DN4423_c0_g2_i2:914-2407(-)